MKPQASPIRCKSYFANELSVSANPKYDPNRPSDLTTEDLQVENSIVPIGEDESSIVFLSVEQHAAGVKNAPYNFKIRLMGYFDVMEGVPKQRAEQLLLTNGSSILYGAAREILRDMTSKGPYPPLLLPTLSFFPLLKRKPPIETREQAEISRQKT
jgi:preprotein translocase subunit SecB